MPSTSQSTNSTKRIKTDSSSGQFALDETSNENVLGDCGAPIKHLSEAKNSDVAEMASGAVKLNLSMSETLKGLGVQTRRDKENVILHFGAECNNFTIYNFN